MNNNLLEEAYKLRFEYYNIYENNQYKWHEKYKNHILYEVVKNSFDYSYKEIGAVMPKLIEKIQV